MPRSEPSKLQMFLYIVLTYMISFLGKLRVFVVSPDGRWNKQYFCELKERLDTIKGDPYRPMLFRCAKCQELYILWERNEDLEWIPVWPEYAEEEIDMGVKG